MKQETKLTLFSNGVLHVIDLDEILYLHAKGAYTTVTLTSGASLLTSKNMKTVLARLRENGVLIRVHRSYCVNVNMIRTVFHRGRKMFVSLRGGPEVPVTIGTMRSLSLFISQPVSASGSSLQAG